MDTSNYKNELKQRLNDKGLDGKELLRILKSTKSFIAGSFPLQVLTGRSWPNSDLDIFTDNESIIGYFSQFLKPHPFTQPTAKNYLNDENYLGFENKTETVKLVEFHMPNGFNIQVIVLKKVQDELLYRVIENFDIDVCKVAFDGERLIVKNMKSIEDKKYTMDLKRVIVTDKKYYRIHKYKSRGYEMTNYAEFMEVYRKKLLCKIDKVRSAVELLERRYKSLFPNNDQKVNLGMKNNLK